MIRVLIVDDSALMRKHLKSVFQEQSGFEVALARNGEEALEKVVAFDPDVVTLDINMPVMDGLTCLSRLMVESPRPVVMVSSLTEQGAIATFEALELGAVDYVPKPGGTVSLNIRSVADDLLRKVRGAARARLRLRRRTPRRTAPPTPRTGPHTGHTEGAVIVGVSTGGPSTLEAILPYLPPDFPLPVLVVQHMPARFTRVFAQRLDRVCALSVQEVARPVSLQAGQVYLGRGDADMVVGRRGERLVAMPVPSAADLLWHPSVDRLVNSALAYMEPERLVGVLLTGMGDDGAEAMAALHHQGGRTIAEAEESAVVFGMPRELIRRNGADCILPAETVAEQVCKWVA